MLKLGCLSDGPAAPKWGKRCCLPLRGPTKTAKAARRVRRQNWPFSAGFLKGRQGRQRFLRGGLATLLSPIDLSNTRADWPLPVLRRNANAGARPWWQHARNRWVSSCSTRSGVGVLVPLRPGDFPGDVGMPHLLRLVDMSVVFALRTVPRALGFCACQRSPNSSKTG